MRRSHRSRIRALCALAALAVLGGCLIGSSSHTTMSGTRVSEETLAMIEPGDGTDAVLSLLGEPTDKASKADGSEVWKWRYQERTESSGSMLFVIGSSKTRESSGTVYVQVRDGKVLKTWRD